jgi:hypothetical protein
MKYRSQNAILLSFLLVCSGLANAQKVELIFSHKYHAEEVGAACVDCHAAADTSSLSSHNLLPDMETCFKCHDSQSECTVCHQDPDNAIDYPRITSYIAKFPHARHIAQKVECTGCHTNINESVNVIDRHLPAMSTCVSCHAQKEAVEYCNSCHAAGEDLKPGDHQLDWAKTHGSASFTSTDNCTMCHTENQCLACHQQDNLDRKVHPFNFRFSHSLSARGNKENCYACHEELAFCSDCHRQELVLPKSHARAGWSNKSSGGGHAREAMLDLDNCLSCHNDTKSEPICLECHRAK